MKYTPALIALVFLIPTDTLFCAAHHSSISFALSPQITHTVTGKRVTAVKRMPLGDITNTAPSHTPQRRTRPNILRKATAPRSFVIIDRNLKRCMQHMANPLHQDQKKELMRAQLALYKSDTPRKARSREEFFNIVFPQLIHDNPFYKTLTPYQRSSITRKARAEINASLEKRNELPLVVKPVSADEIKEIQQKYGLIPN